LDTSRQRATQAMEGTGPNSDLPRRMILAAHAPHSTQWPIMVGDPTSSEPRTILTLSFRLSLHGGVVPDDHELQASSRAAAGGSHSSTLTTMSGQLTTSALPSAPMCRTLLLVCSRKTTAAILSIWKNLTCTMVSNTMHLSSVSDPLYLPDLCMSK
jgi:hypothetical protein